MKTLFQFPDCPRPAVAWWCWVGGFALLAGCTHETGGPASLPPGSIPVASAGSSATDARLLETPNLRLRLAAASWPQLVAKAKPTFTWHTGEGPSELSNNGTYLMWIAQNENGRPQFTLDTAFVYQPNPQLPRQWVLLADDPFADRQATDALDPVLWEEPYTESRKIIVSPRDDAPGPVDREPLGSYAVVKTADPKFGTVYEIAWQTQYASYSGTVQETFLRRLYVFRDLSDRWYFLGEGPPSGEGWGAGRIGAEERVVPRITWKQRDDSLPPVEISFDLQTTWRDFSDEDFPTLETHQATTLPSPQPTSSAPPWQVSGRPYLLTASGDTSESIARRLSLWENAHGLAANLAPDVVQRWQAELLLLNPKLPTTEIPAGTRVEIPTGEEMAHFAKGT